MTFKHALLTVTLLSAMSAFGAPLVAVDGRLVIDEIAVDDVVDVLIEVRDDEGEQRLSLTEADVVVVDGAFVIDLDIATIADDLAAGATMQVEVTVDDLTTSTIIGRVYGAHEAVDVDTAATATTATKLGGIDAASLIAASGISAPGGVLVAFVNLTGVPAGIADGIDNGTIDAVGTGLGITGGALRVTSLTSAQIVDGTVPASALANGSFTTAQISGLVDADVAAASLTSANFAAGMITAAADVSGPQKVLYLRDIACDAGSDDTRERLTFAPGCGRRVCAGGKIRCGTLNECISTGSNACFNDRLGSLVFAPN